MMKKRRLYFTMKIKSRVIEILWGTAGGQEMSKPRALPNEVLYTRGSGELKPPSLIGARCDEGRRHKRRVQDRLDGGGSWGSLCSALQTSTWHRSNCHSQGL